MTVIKANEKGRYFEDYIGDGAYVYMDPARNIVLYTSNGITETNQVVLEPQVFQSFLAWIKRVEEALLRSEQQ